jgi:hypothetical protein
MRLKGAGLRDAQTKKPFTLKNLMERGRFLWRENQFKNF